MFKFSKNNSNIGCYFLTLVLLSLSACYDSVPPLSKNDDNINISIKFDNPTKVPINVYFNSSNSMNGFKNNDLYKVFSEEIVNVADKLTANQDKNKKSPIVENKKTEDIIKVLSKNIDKKNLNIFVTDFSDDFLNNKLSDTFISYLNKGLSIGLLKVDSAEFDGDVVYKLNKREIKYPYKGNRNFYVFMLGEYDNVFDFYKSIKVSSADKILLENKNFEIFSNDIIFKTINFSNSTTDATNKDDKFKKIFDLKVSDQNGKVISDGADYMEETDDRIKQYSISNDISSMIIENTFSFNKVYFTPDFKLLKPKYTISNYSYEKKDFEVDSKLSNALNVSGYDVETKAIKNGKEANYSFGVKTTQNEIWTVKEGSLCKYKVTLDTSKLASGLVYRVILTFYPAQSSNISNEKVISKTNTTYTLSSNYADWNIRLNNIEKCKNQPLNKDCGKTLNIKPFVDKLLEAINKNSDKKNLKVAEFVYLIKKD